MRQPDMHRYFNTKPKSGRLTLYILLLVVAVALMFMARRCSTPSPFEPVTVGNSGGDTIDVAIEYGPMTFYRYDDTLGGFAYDALRLMAQNENLALKFHPVTSSAGGVKMLLDGNIDMVVADTPMTADYDSAVVFTVPVYLDRQVLVQRADTATDIKVESALDLGGRCVTVAANSPMLHRLMNLSAEIGDSIIIDIDSVHGPEQLVIMTALGEIDMTVVNSLLADKMAASYPSLDAGMKISFTQFQSWILRRDNLDLRQRVDSAITVFKLTPSYEALLKRYGM